MEIAPTVSRADGFSEKNDTRLRDLLFVCTVILGGTLFWIAPRPPMGDLPQHVGQVSLLRDLIIGTSRWSDLVRINYFTPYLLGYAVALALSFVMPVLTAFKLCLMLGFYAYAAAGIALRREFNADARLDWLYVPGFFGFAYQYGFYAFLMAAPLGLFFLILAKRFAEASTLARGLAVWAAGVSLFFAHGLVFAFSCAIGAAFLPVYIKRPMRLASAALPYAGLGVLIVAYLIYIRHHALIVLEDPGQPVPETFWGWTGPYGWHRSYNFVLYAVATQMKDWFFLLGVMFMLAAPWLLGSRLNWRKPGALMPMLAIVLIWLAMPSDALGTGFLYHRFAIFLLPAYALMFEAAPPRARAAALAKARLIQIALAVFCVSYLGVLAERGYRFAKENAPFETLLAMTEPGQRALDLVFTSESQIIHNHWTYHSYAAWYQSEQQGFVDANFAYFFPQIIRFRPGRMPLMNHGMMGFTPETFDWHAVEGRIYRYIFVRHTQPLPPRMFQNDECEVVLLGTVPSWSLFERRACH